MHRAEIETALGAFTRTRIRKGAGSEEVPGSLAVVYRTAFNEEPPVGWVTYSLTRDHVRSCGFVHTSDCLWCSARDSKKQEPARPDQTHEFAALAIFTSLSRRMNTLAWDLLQRTMQLCTGPFPLPWRNCRGPWLFRSPKLLLTSTAQTARRTGLLRQSHLRVTNDRCPNSG